MRNLGKYRSVNSVLQDVCEQICHDYCKYPEFVKNEFSDEEDIVLIDRLYTEYCDDCPLNLL